MGNGTRRRNTDGSGAQYAFYIIEPEDNGDARGFAKKLISYKGVHEVYITEGTCGFIVKARVGKGVRAGPIPPRIFGSSRRRVGLAISRYAYTK